MSYAGESIQKKVARALAYAEAFSYDPPQRLNALCLAGPEAHDVGPLTWGKYPADYCGFVDIDERGLARARERMPGCFTHHGPLSTLDMEKGMLQLAVLDFCGHLEGENLLGAVNAAKHMAEGGIMLVTTLRGRERTGNAKRTRISEKVAALSPDLAPNFAGAGARAYGVARDLAGATGFGTRARVGGGASRSFAPRPGRATTITVLGWVAYTGPVSPMLITMLRFDSRPRPAPDIVYFHLPRDEDHAKHSALMLADGAPNAHLLLDVEPATIRAWRAHRSRGTYGVEERPT